MYGRFSIIVSLVLPIFLAGMERQQSLLELQIIRKYTCCPNEFGYLEVQNYDFIFLNKPPIKTYMCGFDSADFNDESYTVSCKSTDIKLLVSEVARIKTPQAGKSFKEIMDKVAAKKIILDQDEAWITHKDLVYRLISHLNISGKEFESGRKFTYCSSHGFICFFCAEPCIHAIKKFKIEYLLAYAEKLSFVKEETELNYKKLFKQVPSLVDLTLKCVASHKTEDECEFLPQELKERLKNLQLKGPKQI